MSVTEQYRALPGPRSVKRLSACDIEPLAAVTAARGENVHVTLTARTGPHAAFKKVVLRTPAEDPETSTTHAVKR
jgi:hypothetical protein